MVSGNHCLSKLVLCIGGALHSKAVAMHFGSYHKMNSSLRLASNKMPARMTEHLKGNRYTNTIYLCTSGMVKISCASRIPRDRKVYRGMSGLKLPKLFLVPGEDGGRGGDEFAFMSTSTKKNVAVRYEPVVCGGYGVVCRGQRREG